MGLIRLALIVLLVYLLYRLIKGLVLLFFPNERVASNRPQHGTSARIGEELVEDPWCHTYVPITGAVALKENGRIIFFCSRECMNKYQTDRGGKS